MIKSILVDLGGVYFTDGTRSAIEKISKKFNLDPNKVKEITDNDVSHAYRKSQITSEEYWNQSKRFLGINADNSELNDLWIGSYDPQEKVIGILRKLKAKGIKLFFFSNNVKERAEFLERKYKIKEFFIDGIYSHIVQKSKREGNEIFKLGLEKTGDKPEEVVVIDDKEEYANKAKQLGMHGIWFRNPEQLEEELNKLIR
ncbi:hypothetical protein CMO83_02995 [Candidatus Woesearchaeota archaeon]|jgi:putative hydrolase of the HAD superfamily|nr:hypothetical protein [Candidatus Woesearchaeota archaeon]|tara:strand:+ start:6081 stop:6680 length:600 start_codon:yes stop_codon:yes gene_type:complete